MYKEKLIVKLSDGLEAELLEKFQEAAIEIEEDTNKSLLESLIDLKESIIEEATKAAMKEEEDEEDMEDSEDDSEEGDEEDMEDSEDEEDMEEEKSKGKKKSMKESVLEKISQTNISIDEDVNALFNGEELTEKFKEKATTIFEAAVSNKIKEYKEQLDEAIDEIVADEVEKVSEELTVNIDKYLDYVIEEWVEENKIALEHGIRTEITEDFINGMKNLFMENYIEIPEGKEDMVEVIESEKSQLEEEYETSVQKNLSLMEEIKDLKKGIVLSEMTKGLTDTEAEKLASLVEDVKFTDISAFTKKVSHLKESYFSGSENVTNDRVIDTEEVITEEVVTDNSMKAYTDSIKRTSK